MIIYPMNVDPDSTYLVLTSTIIQGKGVFGIIYDNRRYGELIE